MTLVQMRYFYEVCQWQNITKAAEQLHVSQPTVTVAMQAIETETGLNLFHREGRKITVTSDGAKLLSKISFILGEVTRLDDEIRDMAHRHAKVRIAMPLQLGVVFLPYLLGEFHEAHPEIELEIIETGGVSALQMVEEEKLDFALTNYTVDFSARLNYSKLFDCECTFVTRFEHPLAKCHTVSIRELCDEPLVMLDSSTTRRTSTPSKTSCAAASPPPSSRARPSSPPTTSYRSRCLTPSSSTADSSSKKDVKPSTMCASS